MNDFASAEMPKYRCHKVVWALKIAAIDGAVLTPAEKPYAPFTVSEEYLEKHKPEVGGYFVVYSDGYKSYSPAGPFEDGYTKVA